VWGVALLLPGLYLAPVPVSLCLPDPRDGVPWHQARRDPTGLSPDPAATQAAVIQVFAAPAVSWRGGVFSVHTWIAVKPTGAVRSTRYEVLGFDVVKLRAGGAVVQNQFWKAGATSAMKRAISSFTCGCGFSPTLT
jgi:hypothetical protein